jgi:hypothetical protein
MIAMLNDEEKDPLAESIKRLQRQEDESLIDALIAGHRKSARAVREVREEMKRVAIAVAAEFVNDYRYKSPEGISVLTTKEIADEVIETVKRKIAHERKKRRTAEAYRARAEEKIEQLQAEIEQLKSTGETRQPSQDHPAPDRKPRPVQEWGNHPAPDREPQPVQEWGSSGSPTSWAEPPAEAGEEMQETAPSSDPQPQRREGSPPWKAMEPKLPPWNIRDPGAEPEFAIAFDAWTPEAREWYQTSQKRRTLKRDCDVIWVLGTGVPLRGTASEIMGAWWDVSHKSGSIRRAFKRGKRLGVLEVVRPLTEETANILPVLVQLTELGEQIYRFLSGHDPAPSYAAELMRRHKSADHAALNIATADVLWQAGYDVDLFPDSTYVDAGRYYPDLRAELHGETIYVECERAIAAKDPDAMAHKWLIYYQVTDGQFYISTPTKEAMEASREQILDWAGKRSVVLHTMNIQHYHGLGPKMVGSDIWVVGS